MTTPNLMLPEVPLAIQNASDELNAGFLTVDAVLQLAVISRVVTVAPTDAIQGDRYIIPSGAIGAWAPRANHIAFRGPAGWHYIVPRPGWLAWSLADAALYVFTDGAWTAFGGSSGSGSGVPIKATWVIGSGAIAVPVTDVAVYVPQAIEITGVSLLTMGGPGSCVVDVWREVLGGYPPTVADSITASAKPTIAAGNTYVDTTLTGWETEIDAGDTLIFHLESTSAFSAIFVALHT